MTFFCLLGLLIQLNTNIVKAQSINLELTYEPIPNKTMLATTHALIRFWGDKIAYKDLKQQLNSKQLKFYDIQVFLSSYGYKSLYCSLEYQELLKLLEHNIPVMLSIASKQKSVVALESFEEDKGVFIMMNPLIKGKSNISKRKFKILFNKAGKEVLLIFPKDWSWVETLTKLELPVQKWIYYNSNYASNALLEKARQLDKSNKKLMLYAQASVLSQENTEANYALALELYNYGFKEEAWVLLSRILLKHNNSRAQMLKSLIENSY